MATPKSFKFSTIQTSVTIFFVHSILIGFAAIRDLISDTLDFNFAAPINEHEKWKHSYNLIFLPVNKILVLITNA